MITRKLAQKRIIKFANKTAGRVVTVSELNDKDLFDFILTDTYLNIDALLGYDADVSTILDRAIQKATSCKLDKFKAYRKDYNNYSTQFLKEGERL